MLVIRTTLFALVLFFSGCLIIPTYKERVSIKTIDRPKEAVSFHNVLVIGSGTVASRVFLENLYTELKRSFEQRGIQSEFTYIGKSNRSNVFKVDSLAKSKFDAYLFFNASDSSVLNMQKVKFVGYGAGILTTGYGNQFSETYTISLLLNRDKVHPVWQSVLKVDFDLAHDYKYAKIFSLINKELELAGLFNN